MEEWWFGIPPPLLIFLVLFGILFIFWLLDKGLEALIDIILHGWFVLFGGKPKHAPERLTKEGGYHTGMLIFAFLLWVVVLIVLPIWERLKIGMIVTVLALLLAFLVQRYSHKPTDWSGRKSRPRAVHKEMRRRVRAGKAIPLLEYNIERLGPAEIICFCQVCGQGYAESKWDTEEKSVQCQNCNAWFCSSSECLKLLTASGTCPKCGNPFSSEQKQRLFYCLARAH